MVMLLFQSIIVTQLLLLQSMLLLHWCSDSNQLTFLPMKRHLEQQNLNYKLFLIDILIHRIISVFHYPLDVSLFSREHLGLLLAEALTFSWSKEIILSCCLNIFLRDSATRKVWWASSSVPSQEQFAYPQIVRVEYEICSFLLKFCLSLSIHH